MHLLVIMFIHVHAYVACMTQAGPSWSKFAVHTINYFAFTLGVVHATLAEAKRNATTACIIGSSAWHAYLS